MLSVRVYGGDGEGSNIVQSLLRTTIHIVVFLYSVKKPTTRDYSDRGIPCKH